MNLTPVQYIPWLRWKQGEYQALLRLSSSAKESIVPLIEIPEIGFDFEAQRASKSIDEHLEPFARRVKQKWGDRACFVDLSLIDPQERMSDGQHPAEFVFNDLRSKKTTATPVIGLRTDEELERAIRDITAADGRGLCLRVGLVEAAGEELKDNINGILARIGLPANHCDLVLDVGTPSFEPLEGFTGMLHGIIMRVPHLDEWQTFGLIGSSFPSSMSQVRFGLSIIQRDEWKVFKMVASRLGEEGVRIPNFGDYGINHPDVLEIDMRLVKPFPSLRYTIEDSWLIAKGKKNTRDHGLGEYVGLCQLVVDSQWYESPEYSEGDRYINDCAQGLESTGNLTTWRWVGTNHHLQRAVNDLASFFGR